MVLVTGGRCGCRTIFCTVRTHLTLRNTPKPLHTGNWMREGGKILHTFFLQTAPQWSQIHKSDRYSPGKKTKQKQASNMAVWTSASAVWFLVFSAAVTSVVNRIVGLLKICRHKGQRRLAVAVTATIKTISLNDRTSFCDRKAATTSGYSSVVSLSV